MSNQGDDLTKIELFAALLREDSVDPETMSPDQLTRYLEQNRVNVLGAQKRFDLALKKAKARKALEVARQRRLKAVSQATSLLSAGLSAVDERIRAMIEKLGERDPEQAQVFAREFEKATPEDRKSLETDLMLLEAELDKKLDNGKGD